jgi:predicted N-acyltransferase
LTERVLTGYRPRYVLLRRAGTLEAGAICSVRDQFQNRFLRSTANWALHRFPCLRIGLPITFDSGLLVRPDVDQDVIWPALLAALNTCARREHASFVGIDHLAGEHAAWPLLERARYHRAQLLTETYLEIAWPSFEAYLTALPKKRRQRIRQIQRRAEQEGVTIQVEAPAAEHAALLRRMVSEVFRRHGEPDTYVADLFEQAAAILGDAFTLLVARRDGEIVGCVGLMLSQGEAVAKWIGLDYARTLNTATYLAFNVALINQAIERGARRLRLGATSYETKQHFGAVAEERFSALAMRSRALNALAGAALQMTGGRVAALPQPTRSPKPKTA